MTTETTETNPLGRTYSSAEVASFLGCSERKVWSLRREIGVGLEVGNRFRFTDADVARIVEALRPAPVVVKRRRRRS